MTGMDKKGPMPQKQRSESPALTLAGIQQVFSKGVRNREEEGQSPWGPGTREEEDVSEGRRMCSREVVREQWGTGGKP